MPSFNDTLTNDIVSFEKLGPEVLDYENMLKYSGNATITKHNPPNTQKGDMTNK